MPYGLLHLLPPSVISALLLRYRRLYAAGRSDRITRFLALAAEKDSDSDIARWIKSLDFHCRRMNTETGAAFSGIDYTAARECAEGHFLCIRGWIFFLDEPLQDLSITIRSSESPVLLHNLARSDVQAAFPGERFAFKSGFWAVVPLSSPGLPSYQVRIHAMSAGGASARFDFGPQPARVVAENGGLRDYESSFLTSPAC